MKKSVYLENIEAGIKRQIKWQNFDNIFDRNEFLEQIINFCHKLQDSKHQSYKINKTRHG